MGQVMHHVPVHRFSCLLQISIVGFLLPILADASSEDFVPARISGGMDDALTCQASTEARDELPRQFFSTFTITRKGTAEKRTLPDNTPPSVEALTNCVLDRLTFKPEVSQFAKAGVRATIRLDVEVIDAGDTRRIGVREVGPLITPPRHRVSPSDALERCVSAHYPKSGASRFVIKMTISADGTVIAMEPPAGAPAWVTEVADCMKPDLLLLPGTRDGAAVESQASMPVVLHAEDRLGNLSYPKPPSDSQHIEDAYSACYPPDQAAMATVTFSFDVETDGSTSGAKIVRGSGDDILDKAAACILARLRFSPMTRDGRAVKANITWDLPVRPPR